jgi:uncharacterized protein (TIGR03083 family)
MNRNDVWRIIDAERSALADLLETLSAAEWEHDSLCEDWTVRDVASHIICSPQATMWSTTVAMLRARGNFDRCVYAEAKRWSARPVDQIVADYRRCAGSRRHPPGTTYLDPLLDILVHTQDIVVPLGRHHPMPPAAACTAADRVWRFSFPFRARKKFAGFRLTATDTAWAAGAGKAVEGPIDAILLLLTGRTISLPRLTGPGSVELKYRMGVPA